MVVSTRIVLMSLARPFVFTFPFLDTGGEIAIFPPSVETSIKESVVVHLGEFLSPHVGIAKSPHFWLRARAVFFPHIYLWLVYLTLGERVMAEESTWLRCPTQWMWSCDAASKNTFGWKSRSKNNWKAKGMFFFPNVLSTDWNSWLNQHVRACFFFSLKFPKLATGPVGRGHAHARIPAEAWGQWLTRLGTGTQWNATPQCVEQKHRSFGSGSFTTLGFLTDDFPSHYRNPY